MRRAGALCAALLIGTSASRAQPQVQLEPSAASACLTASDPKSLEPEYPFLEYKEGKGGRVLVEMRFAGAADRPRVEIVDSSGGEAFIDAVKQHVRSLRVPCLPAAAGPVLLRREYVFQPLQQQVAAGAVEDVVDARRRELLACIRNSNPPQGPSYPARALRNDTQGRVIAVMTYTAPDAPPAVELLHRQDAATLAQAVQPWVQGYRMPCFVPGQDQPVRLSALFTFRFEGSAYGFRALTLTDFIGSTTNLGQRPLVLDTTTMGCPFNLRLWYRQPLAHNQVYSVGAQLPAREPLLAWLRDATLNLPGSSLDRVFADTADIAVPCIKFNIQPKEKS